MTVDTDRFSQGLPDPQDMAPLEFCEACGGEIYPGEDVYVVDGNILHNDWECLVRFIDPEVKPVEEVLMVKEAKSSVLR